MIREQGSAPPSCWSTLSWRVDCRVEIILLKMLSKVVFQFRQPQAARSFGFFNRVMGSKEQPQAAEPATPKEQVVHEEAQHHNEPVVDEPQVEAKPQAVRKVSLARKSTNAAKMTILEKLADVELDEESGQVIHNHIKKRSQPLVFKNRATFRRWHTK